MVGIALVQHFRRIYTLLTELPAAMDLLETNVRVARPVTGSTLETMALDWEMAILAKAGRSTILAGRVFELVVVSECTYNEDSIPALVHVITALATRKPDMLVPVATKVRHVTEAMFFKLMSGAGMRRLEHAALNLPPNPGVWRPSDEIDIYLFQMSD